MIKLSRLVMASVLASALLAGCAQFDQSWQSLRGGVGGKAEDATSMQLVKTNYAALPGWGQDDVGAALDALQQSCSIIQKRAPTKTMQANNIGGTAASWKPACQALGQLAMPTDSNTARQFMQTWFDPYQITTPNGDTGLFTGYYEASLRGSLTPQGPYTVPLYQRPPDLVTVELGQFRSSLQGERVAGRVTGGALQPYSDRQAIVNGALRNKNLELLWVDNPIDAFFLQIQGSGRIILPDTRVIRLGYDGQNGYSYTAIGAELIKRGELTKEDVNMASIRQWLIAHPDQAPGVMNVNKSYVFFKVLDQDQPLGGSGVPLTPERSLAVDPRFIPYGAPVWLATTDPLQNKPLQRLLIAQDTGGAIRGPVRGDVFWGYGQQAEAYAGSMKQRGQAWLLLPKGTDSALDVSLPNATSH
jgi:membrane-bound lytic murein transglycosylase A